ncbi:bcl2-associated agonist of cell death [Bombina bombina]|uniref:bcl2-associated agonist of cell death n=1 Tax=Bombina bombina TaxID=8345 RepID=UPI00235AFEF3|nr:bcl2-associated agonist of cell death [Bombina bombina]
MTASSPPSMFCIEDFDTNKEGAALPRTDPPCADGVSGHQARSSPNIRRQRVKEPRSRTESHSDTTESDTLGDLAFRSRSLSAPSSLMVATRYGRELRRMSDEFDMTFKGLPRPKSAGAAGQLTGSSGLQTLFMNLFQRKKSKGKIESGVDKH